MKEEIKKYWNQLKNGTKIMFKEFFSKENNKKQRANMLSFSRLILLIPILISFVLSITTLAAHFFISTSILVLLGEITDAFDGMVARKNGSTSEFGKLLDQVSDKFFSGIVSIILTIINPLSCAILLGETIILGINAVFKFKYKDINDTSSMIGKIKQFPLSAAFIMGFIAPVNNICQIISTILINTTILFQIATISNYLKRNIEQVKRIKNNKNENDIIDIEEDFSESKNLEKSIGTKNYNNNDKIVLKKDLYINLRNLLKEIINVKEKEPINNYQKIKK